MVDIEWGDPLPSETTGRISWSELLAPLESHPGRWAIIARNVPTHVITRLSNDFPAYEFAGSTVRGMLAATLHARYPPPEPQT